MSGRSLRMSVGNLPDPKLAFTNRVYVGMQTFLQLGGSAVAQAKDPTFHLKLDDSLIFLASPHEGVPDGAVAMNMPQRKNGNFTVGQQVDGVVYSPSSEVALSSINIAIDLLVKKEGVKVTLDADELATAFKSIFNLQIFKQRQSLAMEFGDTRIKLELVIDAFDHAVVPGKASAASAGPKLFGQILEMTSVNFHKNPASKATLLISGGSLPDQNHDLFNGRFNFEDMGIGGLDNQFMEIFRKAFASRMFPGVARELGTNHVRGLLLYGPPGCGKTLIARQIGKILKARPPKIVNGPEVLDKYVGAAEEKIRLLFKDAEDEQAEKGDASGLHIIIFDEMDAVMKTRGSGRGDSGVGDSIVNQLLSKIDGVDSLNNILLIGMTNRKDMIDEAILRPGRLEVHVEISLPDEHGRLQILRIKTADMIKNKRVDDEAIAKLPQLAGMTKNYTGAELEGLVRNAASFALSRHIDPDNPKHVDTKLIKVLWSDFERAVQETVPAFGNAQNTSALTSLFANGVHSYGEAFDRILAQLQRLVKQVATSARTPLLTTLLEGAAGCGKTALAAMIASQSDYPFVRSLSPDQLLGDTDSGKCARIVKLFADAYRSPTSLLFLDDLERLIEYTPVGGRFNNAVLQTLLVLLKRPPPTSTCRLLVVATTSVAHLLEDVQLLSAFHVCVHVSQLQAQVEVASMLRWYANAQVCGEAEIQKVSQAVAQLGNPIGVKALLYALEMAQSDLEPGQRLSVGGFLECLHTMKA